MRRVWGAAMVVLVLGAPKLIALACNFALVSPASVDSPLIVSPAAPSARPPTHGPVPASFRSSPLAFLSRAPADSLDLLPGIGPVLASRIVVARRGRGSFTSWDAVLRVRGVGPRTVRRLRELSADR